MKHSLKTVTCHSSPALELSPQFSFLAGPSEGPGPAGTCGLRAEPALGGGVFARCQAPRFRPPAVATDMLQALSLLSWLLLLAKPAPTLTWSRPLWYQLKLDLQPWGCEPNNPEACGSTLGCPGYWTSLGGNRIYPVAGAMITTTMMLVMGRPMLHRWRSQVTTGQHPQVSTSTSGASRRQVPISDRTLLLRVLHMLDALLSHIEGHLQHLATRQCK
nr:transmembrane protein 89 [Cavia porcellus]